MSSFTHAVNVNGHKKFKAHLGSVENTLDEFIRNDRLIAEGDVRFNSQGQLVMAHDFENADDQNRPSFKEWFVRIIEDGVALSPEKNFGYSNYFI